MTLGKLVLFFLLLTISPIAQAADPSPGDACTVTGAFTKSGGPEASGLNHFLICDGGIWHPMLSADAQGRITHLGNTICNNNDFLRFNGSIWTCSPSTCNDTTPNAFSFTNNTSAALSSTITSDIVQINDIACLVDISVTSLSTTPQYRICGTSNCSTVLTDWTSEKKVVNNGQYVQLRVTTLAIGGVVNNVTVSAGNTSTTWTVKTVGDCTGTPTVGTVCADGSYYAGTTPDGNIPFYLTRCDAGQIWNGEICTAQSWVLPWHNGTTGSDLNTGITNKNTGEANTAALSVLADAKAPYYAAKYCDALNIHGQTDWYLPAENELLSLQSNWEAVNLIISSSGYWSSSDSSAASARRVTNSSSGNSTKTSQLNVRCARK